MTTENMDEIELSKVLCSRFRVMKASEEEDKTLEDDSEKDVVHTRSLRYFTREALPRLDNYRNFMSIQAAYRPTLEDLHDPVINLKTSDIEQNDEIQSTLGRYGLRKYKYVEFGWVQGILIPNLLDMCGSILFLQFIHTVMQTGLASSLLLILFGSVVSIITALSVCAISTNGFVKEGGTYVMMSRSLGPEFGIPIGISLLVSNIGLSVLYSIGLIEYLMDNFNCCFFDCDIRDARYFSSITFLITTLLVFIPLILAKYSSFIAKVQLILCILIFGLFGYFISHLLFIMQPDFNFDAAKLRLNFSPIMHDGKFEHLLQSFFIAFAHIYPAFSAFFSGINTSENLKDPLRAIPKGTILSILITIVVYFVTALVVSGSVVVKIPNNINNATTCSNFVCQLGRPLLHSMLTDSMNSHIVIKIIIILSTTYCIVSKSKTAVTALRCFTDDKLYPSFPYFRTKMSKLTGVLIFVTLVGFIFVFPGSMNGSSVMVSIVLLASCTMMNFSTFHISLIQPIGWRPTFKKYNMFVSLGGSVLCLAIMFLINWVIALIAVIILLAMYLLVTYQKPDVNWGSTTQAQTYNNALLSVYALNSVADHVKNFRPQVLVLTGLPSSRPPLVHFARLITKNLSLLICGNIHSIEISQKGLDDCTIKARNWLKFNRIKAFYTQIDEVSFEDGAKSLMQSTGLGKLRPNVLLMGYKSTWMSSSKKDVNMYFNIIHKALDKHLAVCILRVKTGINFSDLKVNHEKISKRLPNVKYEFKNLISHFGNDKKFSGENLLCRKLYYTNEEKGKTGELSSFQELNDSCEDITADEIYKNKDGMELSGDMISHITMFQGKQKKGTIDVWWLYDDGGLTLLLPYIVSTRRSWASCKLRVFALAENADTLECEQRNMASLLSKFRIDYSDLTIFSGLTKKPQEETQTFYDNLVKNLVKNVSAVANSEEKISVTENDLCTMQEKTNRHLRLRELLLENSQDANLIVMTLPIPRKSVISAALYMSWLEALTQDMPPFLLVRGNQTSVLTFYS